MPSPTTYPDLHAAYVGLLTRVSDDPDFRISARGNDAAEIIGASFRLPDPRQRLPYLAARKANPVFHYAETLWYLAGRRDLDMIGYYAPSMRSGSADGIHLGGSAYGHTIFQPAPGASVSPFDRAMDLLRTEADTKRAYIPVFTAGELNDPDNPDMACLAGLHLLPRQGRLHMVCYMRANDLDCGLLSDVFSFTMIQEYAAVRLGLELGTYTHHIGSAHICDRNADRVRRVLDEAATVPSHPAQFAFPTMPAATDTATLDTVLRYEELLRTDQLRCTAADIAATGLDVYWQQPLLLFEIYRQIQHERTDHVSTDVLGALDPGLRWLVEQRWPACTPTTSTAGDRR
ncbi:thymidylate synthase [Actinacidiphila alni]|uniref:Thymidylate synthase n=1 Tax=Actinacidiphila alni TaxID=380248 RepID=A0A1I2L7V6_9ACTN|nr:thymidylate synthase [Actinacidiphila alni]SFF75285.1 thymidylate synthase [Actinacidiphila alni]